MNRLSYHHIIPSLLVLLLILIPASLSAGKKYDSGKEYDLDWKWRSNPIHNGSTTVEIEYDFKNDSVIFVTFDLVETLPDGGTYEAKVKVDGHYVLAGNMVNVHLNRESASINYEKLTPKKVTKGSKGTKASNANNANGNTVTNPTEVWRKAEEKKRATIDKMLADYAMGTIPLLNRKDKRFTTVYETRSNNGNNENGILRGEFQKLREGVYAEYEPLPKVHKPGYYVTSEFFPQEIAQNKEHTSIKYNGKPKPNHNYIVLLAFIVLVSLYCYLFREMLPHILDLEFHNYKDYVEDAKDSVSRVKRCEVNFFFSLQALCLVGEVILIWGFFFFLENYEDPRDFIFLGAIGIGILILSWIMVCVRMNLRIMDIDKFKEKIEKKRQNSKDKGYVLYLKTYNVTKYYFEYYNDNLQRKIITTRPPGNHKTLGNFLLLDEEEIIKAWKMYYKVYTMSSPINWFDFRDATQVMLDQENDQWKEDVLYMMENAKYIVINAHPYENGTYLIEQAAKLFPEKTVYYVDYVETLPLLKEQLGDDLPKCMADYYRAYPETPETLEELDPLIEKVDLKEPSTLDPVFIYTCMYQKDGKSQFTKFTLTKDDLLETATDVIHGKIKDENSSEG